MSTKSLPYIPTSYTREKEKESYARKTVITSSCSSEWDFDNTEDEAYRAKRKHYEDAAKSWPTKPIWTGDDLKPYPGIPDPHNPYKPPYNPYLPSYPSIPVYPHPHTPEDIYPEPDIYPPDTYPYPSPSDFIPKPKTPLTPKEIEEMVEEKNRDIIDAKDALIKKLQRELAKQKKEAADKAQPPAPITPAEDFI